MMGERQTPSFEPDFASPPEWALMYRVYGLQVVPSYDPDATPNKQWKRPLVEWIPLQEELIPQFTFDRWYGPTGQYVQRTNMGMLTGRCSGNIFVIDLDTYKTHSAKEWWNGLMIVHNFNGDLETWEQITGGNGRQKFYRAPAGWEAPTNRTNLDVDIRGQGGFAVLPPSKHTSGNEYQWAPGRAPWEIEIAEAPQWLLEAVEELVLVYGGKDERTQHVPRSSVPPPHDVTDPISGQRLEGRESAMFRQIFGDVVNWHRELKGHLPAEHESRARMEAAFQIYVLQNKSRLPANGAPEDLLEMEGRGRSLFQQKWRYLMARWDKKVAVEAAKPRPHREGRAEDEKQNSADEQPAEGHATSPLDPIFDPWDAYVVPTFPFEILPAQIQDFVELHSILMGCDPSGLAMAALVNFSAALSHRFAVKMMRNGNWWVNPRLWVLLVGDPSRKKTPIIKAATHDLEEHQNQVLDAHIRAVADHYAAGGKEEDEPRPPARYIAGDTTIEKLGELLSRSDRGLLVKRDELSGWIGSMEKYTNGAGAADRAFWLQCYDGGPYTVDRIKRGELRIDNLSVSFIGGIQPARLAEFRALTTDGLLQRFLPVMLRESQFPEDQNAEQPFSFYRKATKYLTSVHPRKLMLTDGALETAGQIRRQLHDLEQASGGLASGFQAFVGKLPGVVGSLAIILHMIYDHAENANRPIERVIMERVGHLVFDFLIPHAHEFYGSVESLTDGDRIQKIASWILTSGKTRIVSSDLTANVSICRGLSLFDINQRVSPLVAGNWLVPVEKAPLTRSWTVNPEIFEQLKARTQDEEARKKAVSELMNSSKRQKGRRT